VSVATGDADSTGEDDGDALGSAAAIELELRQTKQISAHKTLFRGLISHHCIDGSRTKGGLYLGSSRCARPLPRGVTGHVAHSIRSIVSRQLPLRYQSGDFGQRFAR
jgi:hypothetical protein